MRILYVPNEWGAARQFGMRRAFATLVDNGLIDAVKIFSLLWRIRDGQNRAEATDELVEIARNFRPHLVLMQHLGGTGLGDDFFTALRSAGQVNFIYHEADPYSRWKHRLPREAKNAGRHADVVFTVGAGTFRQNFIHSGSRNVAWCPSIFDPGRFGIEPPTSPASREFDVVMIANKSQARSPFSGHPNSRQREELVTRLSRRFGKRFAVYGKGWTGPSAQGPVDYSSQTEAIHSGWVSANWDHYAGEANYFSDRLPTTLATGSVHITTEHPGFEYLFPEDLRFLQFARTPKGIVDKVEKVLGAYGATDFSEAERASYLYAHKKFRQDDQLVMFINHFETSINPVLASSLWTPDSRILAEL